MKLLVKYPLEMKPELDKDPMYYFVKYSGLDGTPLYIVDVPVMDGMIDAEALIPGKEYKPL